MEVNDDILTNRREQEQERSALLLHVARRIRTVRLEKGISQEDLAQRTGRGRTYVSLVERGEVNVSLVNLSRIARGLEVSISALVPGPHELETEASAESVALPGLKRGPKSYSGTQGTATGPGNRRQLDDPGETKIEGAALVTAGVAARMLGVSRRTIGRWVENGRLEAEQVEDSGGRLNAVFRRDVILLLAPARHEEQGSVE